MHAGTTQDAVPDSEAKYTIRRYVIMMRNVRTHDATLVSEN